MMFQRAPPEVNGLGVTTSTPGSRRSSQSWIPFGLPGRVTRTTTEFVTIPLCGWLVQSAATRPDSTSLSRSGASESATTSASSPAITARVCSPELP